MAFLFKIIGREGSKLYFKSYQDDLYFDAYLSGICYREDCYKCRYAGIQRSGDLTIGDYDGKRKFENSNLEKEKNYSLVLVNTVKGENFFRTICNRLIYEEKSVEDAIENNHQLHHPVPIPPERKQFKKRYVKLQSFVKAYKIIFQKKQAKKFLASIPVYKLLSLVKRKYSNELKR